VSLFRDQLLVVTAILSTINFWLLCVLVWRKPKGAAPKPEALQAKSPAQDELKAR
jgi:hypothetical protein